MSILYSIYSTLVDILNKVTHLTQKFVSILARLNAIDTDLNSCCKALNLKMDDLRTQQQAMDKKLDHIIQSLTPPPPVAFRVTLVHTGEI